MKRTITTTTAPKLSDQIKGHTGTGKLMEEERTYDGDASVIVSTGSTLLDLAISGGRIKGGGLPAGILVEIFGPPSSGKTVILCEIAGNVQRTGGEVIFGDPESRLNKQFAHMFGLDIGKLNYYVPNTIVEVFTKAREWKPKDKGVHGIFTDSLAALSTEMEMEKEDLMGMRRAKDFSTECRKTCRILTKENYLMVCSNQVRQNQDAGPYGQKYISPGGEAIGFYSSLRLRCFAPQKIRRKKTIMGKEVSRVTGVETQIEVFKSSVWKPYRTANLIIDYDYGIDDIRQNLLFLREYSGGFNLGEISLGNTIEGAIISVEEQNLEGLLKSHVIDLWEDIEKKFGRERKPKRG